MSCLVTTATVNHVTVDVAASADDLWRVIVAEYVEAEKFRDEGYTLEPLAEMPGYRMYLDRAGGREDERVVHLTEVDDAARRVSLFARYVDDPDGVVAVVASYQAQPTATGCRYALDSHALLELRSDADAAGGADAVDEQSAIARILAGLNQEFGDYLADYVDGIRVRVEAAAEQGVVPATGPPRQT